PRSTEPPQCISSQERWYRCRASIAVFRHYFRNGFTSRFDPTCGLSRAQLFSVPFSEPRTNQAFDPVIQRFGRWYDSTDFRTALSNDDGVPFFYFADVSAEP